jgi:hypothetical protein
MGCGGSKSDNETAVEEIQVVFPNIFLKSFYFY